MPTTDSVRIGRMRISRRKFRRRIYQAISILILFLFVSALVVTILWGKNPTAP